MLTLVVFKGICCLTILENKILDRRPDNIYNVFRREVEVYTLQRRLRNRIVVLSIWVMICVVVYKCENKTPRVGCRNTREVII